MSSVVVSYKFREFQASVAANGSLQGVLQAALAYFQLDPALNWHLTHNGRSVKLDLPWRLLNMPQGCKLELQMLEERPVEAKNLKIRFHIVGIDSIVKEVGVIEHVALKIIEILTAKQLNVASLSKVKIRVFSSTYQWNDILQKTFADLGITEPTKITVSIPEYAESSQSQEQTHSPTESEKQEATRNETSKMIESTNNTDMPKSPVEIDLKKPVAYIPSQKRTDFASLETDDVEMTLDQAVQYQNMLAKKAGTLGGPLLTKRLREQYENKHKSTRHPISKCTIRIKFSDGTVLELEFHKDATMEKVYSQVKENLIDEDSKFYLYQSHPHTLMDCNDQKLVDDLNFGSKNILICEFINSNNEKEKKSGPFIKQSLLEDAKPIITAVESQTSNKGSKEEMTPSEPITSPKIKKSLNKVPKWLKLSKK